MSRLTRCLGWSSTAMMILVAASCSSEATVETGELDEALSTTSFQDGVSPTTGYTGTRDTMLQENSPTTNSGTATAISVSGDTPAGSAKDQVSLMQWDVSATIPSNAIVTSASITVYVSDKSPQ